MLKRSHFMTSFFQSVILKLLNYLVTLKEEKRSLEYDLILVGFVKVGKTLAVRGQVEVKKLTLVRQNNKM
ncbi:hypothetical protein [Streptococcus thoraltensis]|uniref:hypothetical protein n=1 Tax=Streptococcus thoraltensis TaxID=55085 RepID=UPI001F566947|nr:hypothetical protein [Streptococcus thoraltensis]